MDEVPVSVLVLDFDPRTLNVVATYLARRGYSVQAASSAREGYIAALRDQPDAIIFDPRLPDMPGVDFLRRLRSDRRTATTLCIALAKSTDSALMAELMAAGCNEFLLKTPDVFEKLIALLQPHPAEQLSAFNRQNSGLLVVFLSAKGGTGTSSLCANIAQNMVKTHPEMDVAVLDIVLPLGSIGSIVGYEEEFSLMQATAEPPENVNRDYLRHHLTLIENWDFRLLTGPADPEAASKVDASRIPALIRASRQAFDITLVDLGRSLSRISLPIILEADVVALVMAADLNTATLSRTVWDYLQTKGLQHQRVYPILNRVVGPEGLSKSDSERLLGLQIQATIPYMMGNFSLANNQHLPVSQRFPNDTAAMMVSQISRDIIRIARQGRS